MFLSRVDSSLPGHKAWLLKSHEGTCTHINSYLFSSHVLVSTLLHGYMDIGVCICLYIHCKYVQIDEYADVRLRAFGCIRQFSVYLLHLICHFGGSVVCLSGWNS